MIDPRAYDDLLEQVETDMRRARTLGLFHTAAALHAALNEARAARFEAAPVGVPTVTWRVGPVREQPQPTPAKGRAR